MPKSCKRSTHEYDPALVSGRRVCLNCPHCQMRQSAEDAWTDDQGCVCPICREEAKATMREDPRLHRTRRV